MLQIVTSPLKRVLQDRRGISAMEYTVLAIGIVGVVAAAAATLGGSVSTALVGVSSFLTTPST